MSFEVVSRKDRHGEPLTTVLCGGCGMLRNDPVPSEADLAAFYKSRYRESYKGASEPRRRQVWRNFRRVSDHIVAYRDVYARGGDWLDLGAGSCEFTFLAGRLGARVTAVEPHSGYAAYAAQRLGVQVLAQRLEDCDFAGPSFDLIRLSHVLEHMRDPVAALRQLAGWLRPGGVLYVEVPDIEADARNKVRGRLFHFGHIHNFNPVLLRHVAGLAGLVELPQTAARSAGRCGVFLVVGEGGQCDAAALAANAARMRAAMAAHNARTIPEPAQGTAAGRFLLTLRARAQEQLAGMLGGSPRKIAEAASARLERSVLAG
ncbi:methyltransferase domain-containing protein [Rhodobacter sp. CCP-1]|uniref:Methyltransferase domain-containing protein n=1 Tax=Paragemmobacter ruber TaxID=1985673 RepID=A0ABW9Y8J6_9RHOB|nr:methyltransferase domain-containing protein [Rhodobacter ruber]